MKKFMTLLVLALIGIDQLTKWLAENNLPFHEAVEIMPFFSLYLTYNTGVAFSFLSNVGSGGLIALTLVITCVMLYLWRKVPADQQLASLGFALVVSGALGQSDRPADQGPCHRFFSVSHADTGVCCV